MSDLVSLVMPAWRPRPEWFVPAVTSALDEDACDVELIVVDDGNDEPVAGLLAGIGDPRLTVLRAEHSGPYGARNAGLARARGSYVRFLDADDVVVAGSTGRLLALAQQQPGTIAYGATELCDAGMAPYAISTSDVEGDAVPDCVAGGFDVFVVSLLFPRDVVDRAGPWATDFPVSGDWDFVLRALEQAPVRRLDEVVTRYRRHGSSVTGTADVAAGAIAGELVLSRHFARHPERRGEAERRAYARLYTDRALAHAARGEHGRALGQLRKTARHDPRAALLTGARIARSVTGRAARRAGRAPRTPA